MSEGLVVFVTLGGGFWFDGMIQVGPREQSHHMLRKVSSRTLVPSPTGIDGGTIFASGLVGGSTRSGNSLFGLPACPVPEPADLARVQEAERRAFEAMQRFWEQE